MEAKKKFKAAYSFTTRNLEHSCNILCYFYKAFTLIFQNIWVLFSASILFLSLWNLVYVHTEAQKINLCKFGVVKLHSESGQKTGKKTSVAPILQLESFPHKWFITFSNITRPLLCQHNSSGDKLWHFLYSKYTSLGNFSPQFLQ